MSRRKTSSGNLFTKNLGRLVEKAGSRGLDTFLDVANGPGKSKGTGTTALPKGTDWSSRPVAPAPPRRRSR